MKCQNNSSSSLFLASSATRPPPRVSFLLPAATPHHGTIPRRRNTSWYFPPGPLFSNRRKRALERFGGHGTCLTQFSAGIPAARVPLSGVAVPGVDGCSSRRPASNYVSITGPQCNRTPPVAAAPVSDDFQAVHFLFGGTSAACRRALVHRPSLATARARAGGQPSDISSCAGQFSSLGGASTIRQADFSVRPRSEHASPGRETCPRFLRVPIATIAPPWARPLWAGALRNSPRVP